MSEQNDSFGVVDGVLMNNGKPFNGFHQKDGVKIRYRRGLPLTGKVTRHKKGRKHTWEYRDGIQVNYHFEDYRMGNGVSIG